MMHPPAVRPTALAAAPAATAMAVTSALALALTAALPHPAAARQVAPTDPLLTVDHYVPVPSAIPGFEDETMQIYVRERVLGSVALRGGPDPDRVVVFVHGAGTPGEVAFDVPYEDYSWMSYLARAGFDVFTMDMTGYGRSTRPGPMNDPCNLSENDQASLLGHVLPAPCERTYPHAMTTIASDWNDLSVVVEYVRRLRGVDQVSLIGWSLGGPRAGGYAARNPDRVRSMVLLAPAYGRNGSSDPPDELPGGGAPMGTQTFEAFMANWNRQVGCPNQYDPAVGPVIWSEMMASDPVGATWGPGVRRAPRTTTWGWNQEVVSGLTVPTLLVAGVHDAQVSPERVGELYEDLGSASKVFVDLGCAAHGAMWERNHDLLFAASLEWLTERTVEGQSLGVVRLGY